MNQDNATWADGSSAPACWTPPVFPLRRVVRREDWTNKYCRPGEGRRSHFLECGHEVCTKQSAGHPERKRCRECHQSNAPREGSAVARTLDADVGTESGGGECR